MNSLKSDSPVKPRKISKFIKITAIILIGIIGASIALIVAIVAYVLIARPFTLPINEITQENTTSDVTNNPTNITNYNIPTLTSEQLKTIESFGIDTSAIPTTLSQAQIDCLNQKLGEDRVKQIISGGTVSPVDFFKARDCIKL